MKKADRGHDIVFTWRPIPTSPTGTRIHGIDSENCTVGTFHMLEAMRANGVRQFIFASSSTVFGEPPIRPTPETVGPVLPISLYGAGKMAGERADQRVLPPVWDSGVDLPLRQRRGSQDGSHGVIYDFIRKLKASLRELEILGDGKQEKNYFLV